MMGRKLSEILRQYILEVEAHALRFSRLRIGQLEGDAVDGGCCLFFEVNCPSGHL